VAEKANTLPITDERMTRFWITQEQTINFAISCISIMVGGEVFVPKIPSMRILDLAQALAPGIDRSIVGVRPGEKLHEAMITKDDARNTVEMSDRYMILPSFKFWDHNTETPNNSKPVAQDFEYTSDTNDEWLSAETLLKLCEDQ
jgi:UDP-N-acetylglucosamine 4,6-dehydratase